MAVATLGIDAAPGFKRAVTARIEERPGATPTEVAESIAGEMSPAQLHSLAVWHLRTIADEVLRGRARKVETASTRTLRMATPRLGAPEAPTDEAALGHISETHNAKARRACERCLCPACVAALNEYAVTQAEWNNGWLSKLGSLTTELTETLSHQIRLEITAELLETEFALGDGSRVTWGDATAADHEKRIEMLEGNIAANADTAAKHRAALRLLQAESARTLSEIGVAA